MMFSRIQVCLLVISTQLLFAILQTNGQQDAAALKAIKDEWQNTPPTWGGSDPCNGWDGIQCTKGRVTAIQLASMNVSGQLTGDMWQLSELVTLDLSYNKFLTGPIPPSISNLEKLTSLLLVGCGFSGPIPDTIGTMENLYTLSLNSNGLTGEIPASLGNLNVYWLDLADNKLTGSIPVSSGTKPGLDKMIHTKHFHFGHNQLSGTIPDKIFNQNMSLIHVLFENNQLSESIPETLGSLPHLEVLRLDRNFLSGPVPNLSSLTGLQELYLANNKLTDTIPDLTGMNGLHHMDLSNNTFDASTFPSWVLNLQSLTTLVMENVGLTGNIPTTLFSLAQLQTITLKSNKLDGTDNGTLDLGTTPSSQLNRVDLQNNTIQAFTDRGRLDFVLILVDNPICGRPGVTYCTVPKPKPVYSTPPRNCMPATCTLDRISSPKCKCAYPYTGTLTFRAPSFSDFGNVTLYSVLENSLNKVFVDHKLPVDSVSLSNPTKNIENYFVLSLAVFPSGQENFNRTGVSWIAFTLSNQTYKPPKEFGPFYFIGNTYGTFADAVGSHKSSNTGIIIGAAVGGSILLVLALLAGYYAFRQSKRADKADKINNPFASWDPNDSIGAVPQLKGARPFTFSEVKKYTNNFSESQNIGSGGYGQVYRGTLPTGQLVAIKRAQKGSMQGGLEFKTEIELLSRVHHKNVVTLIGFCFEQDEQMLVYEYVPNGTLKDSISGKSGIRLDWMRRLRIALGGARGLQYLHELANPTIIHRDIKTNNILLDEKLNAKVADFGLSKLAGDMEKGHVTTQVKGTMGYLDPEYYMTNQLTEKSDVYSFGVLLLELVTGKQPIEKGKYIVREVRQRMDTTKPLYNLQEIIDPIVLGSTPTGLEKFVDMALRCVEEAGADRPTAGEVVKEIEEIMKMAGLNPNADSTTTSENYGGVSGGFSHPYSDESLFVYSGAFPAARVEPQ